MNEQLQQFARQQIKDGLSQLPEGWQLKFKRMYAHGNLEKDIDVIVDDMPTDKLDWAMEQVRRSIEKLTERMEGL